MDTAHPRHRTHQHARRQRLMVLHVSLVVTLASGQHDGVRGIEARGQLGEPTGLDDGHVSHVELGGANQLVVQDAVGRGRAPEPGVQGSHGY